MVHSESKKHLITVLLLAAAMCLGVLCFGKMTPTKAVKQKKPKVLISSSEVYLTKMRMEKDLTSPSGFRFFAKVKNTSKQFLKKAIYTYKVSYTIKGNPSLSIPDSLQTETETLIVKDVEAKDVSEEVSCIGSEDGNIESMVFESEQIYAGEAVSTYYPATETYEITWGTPDTTSPKISGLVKTKSICQKDPYLTVYCDKKKGFNYKKFITVTDDRDLSVDVKADTSGINFDKSGKYKVKFTAVDSAGNKAKSWAYVKVIVPDDLEDLVDGVLKKIIKKDWSQLKKARVIYKYVRGHVSYIDKDKHVDWREVAVDALLFQSGDCFSYYSLARALLTRAGIPNIMIRRYPYVANHNHWWNLVYIKNGWYHFDTSPRRAGGVFCLVTDAQLKGYAPGNTFAFKKKTYPKRATKKISPDPKKNR